MNSWMHLLVVVFFLAGAFLVDFDHLGSCSFKELWDAFNGKDQTCERGILHNPMIFYCLLALTVGLGIHLMMDGVL